MTECIRNVALAIILRPVTGELLVFEGRDPSRGLVYHRPLGGGILFGESVEQAAKREVLEEIGVEVDVKQRLKYLECRFVVGGQRKHEINFPVECAFQDKSLYKQEVFEDIEGHGEHGIWRKLENPVQLFPENLRESLRKISLLFSSGFYGDLDRCQRLQS